jgi:hypothetical protein
MSKEYIKKNIVIDMSIYSKGSYFLKILNNDGVHVEKVIKN